ncbi:hypothetical protein TNIN_420921 [Trichonephila inaurata madagascariensis]|uniref:Uncharacterized protein n=1 Tax=Trichonephila inaurata madagascariensis TaxID=2747483 RepID=A0A8X6YNH7_9ARAC|nr:hypothetical protein TNIN_420921 [Trichonephila inaurata madagascariensis]
MQKHKREFPNILSCETQEPMFFHNYLHNEIVIVIDDRITPRKENIFEDLKLLNKTIGEKNVFTSSISAASHEKRRLRKSPATTQLFEATKESFVFKKGIGYRDRRLNKG